MNLKLVYLLIFRAFSIIHFYYTVLLFNCLLADIVTVLPTAIQIILSFELQSPTLLIAVLCKVV